jgi:hypothetical protein
VPGTGDSLHAADLKTGKAAMAGRIESLSGKFSDMIRMD